MISALLFGTAFASLHPQPAPLSYAGVGADGAIEQEQIRYIPGGPIPPGGLGPPPAVPGMANVAYEVPGIDFACFDKACGKKLDKLHAKSPRAVEAFSCMRRAEGEDIVGCLGSMDKLTKAEGTLFTCAMGNNCIKGAQPLESLVERPANFDNAMIPEEFEDVLGEAINMPAAKASSLVEEGKPKMDGAIEKGIEHMKEKFGKFDKQIGSHIAELKNEEKHIKDNIKNKVGSGVEAARKKAMDGFKEEQQPSFIQIAQDKNAADIPFGKFASWLEDDSEATKPSSFIQTSPGSFAQAQVAMTDAQYEAASAANWGAIKKNENVATDAMAKLESRVEEAKEDMRQAKESKHMRQD